MHNIDLMDKPLVSFVSLKKLPGELRNLRISLGELPSSGLLQRKGHGDLILALIYSCSNYTLSVVIIGIVNSLLLMVGKAQTSILSRVLPVV